jgi:hypothetical protein
MKNYFVTLFKCLGLVVWPVRLTSNLMDSGIVWYAAYFWACITHLIMCYQAFVGKDIFGYINTADFGQFGELRRNKW